MELIFGIAIAAIAIAFVGRPLYLARVRGRVDAAPSSERLEALWTQRDTIYDSIREVDLDRELGRVSQEDHERHRREYVTQAAAVLRRIDDLGGDGLDRRIEMEVARLRDGRLPVLEKASPLGGAGRGAKRCRPCGAPVGAGDRFCRECGNRLEGDSP